MNSVKTRSSVRRQKKPRKSYHHGDLRKALVEAAEEIILERGVQGFTLREAARRAGVSPAAPAHHFGDAKGLLGEVALQGFRAFGDALDKADREAGEEPEARLRAQGRAYVAFAFRYPARFQLMFLRDRYRAGPELREASERSFLVLEHAIRALCSLRPDQEMTQKAHGLLLVMWSSVHGFAHLALGGELDFAAEGYGGKKAIISAFLPLMLQELPKRPRTD